jgi:aldose 1-epimerase
MSTRYSVTQENDFEIPVVVLNDGQGRRVRIAPSAGFNAYSFRMPRGSGEYAIFNEPKSGAELRAGGFSFGCPILFPFPNRTREGKYRFQGNDYQLDVNFKDGHAIHGLVCVLEWNLVETGADESRGAWATGTIRTDEHSEVMRQYPFSCELCVTYSLKDESLTLDAQIINTGDTPLPMGFGIHPWFNAPLGEQGSRDDCELHLPSSGRWKLESDEQLLPTGEIVPLNDGHDFSRPRALKQQFLDDVFTRLQYEDGQHITTFCDPQNRLHLEVRASQNFREHVVYAPLDRGVICLEPYTGTTNFVNLAEQGVDAGLIALAPQDAWRGTINIICRDENVKGNDS